MTAKLKHIIDQLDTIVMFKADKSMTDDDFIAGIEAYLLLCSLNADLNIDCSGLRSRRGRIFSEFIRRINLHSEVQLAIPLIRMLHDFIYDRGHNHIPVKWKDTFSEICSAVVESYRKNPLISVTDYLFALDTASRKDYECDNDDIKEYKAAINALLVDIENVSPTERVQRVKAYDLSHFLFIADNWDKWAKIKALLKSEDYRQFADEAFLTWCDVTDQYPVNELKKRSDNSKLMMVEYLRSLAISEFRKQHRLKANRKLAKDLKTLNDEIIGDFIDTKIDATMPLSTLRALESIFYLRLQLAQVGWEDNEPIYEALCRNRFEQLIKTYTKKYAVSTSLSEKVEILNRIQIISSVLYLGDSEFVLEKQEDLLNTAELTFAQRYRLENLFESKDDNVQETMDRLLAEVATSFDIALLFDLDTLGTPAQYAAVMDLYKSMFNKAIAEDNTTEIANLLAISADCNSNPTRRKDIENLTSSLFKTLHSDSLSLPVSRINEIAAIVYAQIDKITGKYDATDEIPA